MSANSIMNAEIPSAIFKFLMFALIFGATCKKACTHNHSLKRHFIIEHSGRTSIDHSIAHQKMVWLWRPSSLFGYLWPWVFYIIQFTDKFKWLWYPNDKQKSFYGFIGLFKVRYFWYRLCSIWYRLCCVWIPLLLRYQINLSGTIFSNSSNADDSRRVHRVRTQ